MSMRRMVSALLLLILMVAQFAVLAVPSALVLAGQTPSSWRMLSQQLRDGPAPLAGLAAVLAALLLGTPAALALWRRQGWGLIVGVLLTPLLLPVALLGGNGATMESLGVLLAGHASLGLALGTACGLVGLSGVDPGMLRAAASCGVSPASAYRRVVWPLMAPGVVGGFLLSATASLATSLVALSLGRPPSLAALLGVGLSPALAVGGVALLLCAGTGSAMVLLRRP
jgi:putative spermidine/putrescine transport system permease protein